MKPRRLALLIALPLALLVPLRFIKGRADHPLLSPLDTQLRAEAAQSKWVYLSGVGARWRQLTGLKDEDSLLIYDHTALHNLVEALRCTREPTKSVMGDYDSYINIGFSTPGGASGDDPSGGDVPPEAEASEEPSDPTEEGDPTHTWFTYFYATGGTYLGHNKQGTVSDRFLRALPA